MLQHVDAARSVPASVAIGSCGAEDSWFLCVSSLCSARLLMLVMSDITRCMANGVVEKCGASGESLRHEGLRASFSGSRTLVVARRQCEDMWSVSARHALMSLRQAAASIISGVMELDAMVSVSFSEMLELTVLGVANPHREPSR